MNCMDDTQNKINLFFRSDHSICLFFLICMYMLFFEEPLAWHGISVISVFRNLLPLAAIPLFIHSIPEKTSWAALFRNPYMVCGIVFIVSGLAGWVMNHYQTFSITVRSLYEHIRFWLSLYVFICAGRRLDLKKNGTRLFVHTACLTAFLFVLTVMDMVFHIWPRQMYRYGTSSIQLFFGHPSNLGARAVFLIGMLCLLFPFLPSAAAGKRTAPLRILDILLTFCSLGIVIQTLRVRLFGLTLIFLILFVWMIILKKKLHLPVLAAGIAGMLLIGGRRLYDFYFSPYASTMARGQFAINSLDIARQYFPFGSGFGTFGSRMAQIHYSPLYYKYEMMLIPGLSPQHPNFACDTFFPMLLGESGWLGLAAYLGLLLTLTLSVFCYQKKARGTAASAHFVFTAFILLAYELLESTGTLAFPEIYSVLIALALGLVFSQMRP